MKQHTNEAIIAEITRLYTEMVERSKSDRTVEYIYISHLEVLVEVNTPGSVRVKISDMYRCPPLDGRLLFPLMEFFDTKHINDVDRWSEGGCETCDYGSDYGFELGVRP